MKRLMLTVATAALGIGMAMPSYAQTTDADCRKMFDAADTNKDGSLGAGESDKFIVLMSTKPKDAAMVTMEEFLAECRNDAFKSIEQAAAPATDTNAAAKSSSDAASTTTTEQSATAEQPAASGSSTTTTEQSTATVTTEQPSTSTTTTEQSTATAEQPSTSTTTTTEQPATTTTEQSTATAEQPAATTTEQPATTTTEQSTATAEQPAATTTEQPAATGEQPAAVGAPGDMLASKLIGTTVMSNDNQNIGEINDIVIDVENEQAPQAIIGVGGFLGIGEKNVAIELNRLNVRTDGTTGSWTVVLDTTEDELKQMPEYQAAAK